MADGRIAIDERRHVGSETPLSTLGLAVPKSRYRFLWQQRQVREPCRRSVRRDAARKVNIRRRVRVTKAVGGGLQRKVREETGPVETKWGAKGFANTSKDQQPVSSALTHRGLRSNNATDHKCQTEDKMSRQKKKPAQLERAFKCER